MIYKDFKGKKISALGMGGMRFPTLENKGIDMKATERMFDYAIENGVNYFDTAWGYHNGNSEIAVGKLLKKYPRESFFLASKYPGFDISCFGNPERFFEKQLEKCQVDYFDFYLFHNVCEANIDLYLNRDYGTFDYLVKQKREGRIKHLGFSAHGDIPVIKRFLDAYGDEIEFCQLEINYFDWKFQNAKEKVELMKERNIPIWVMEPVRGGQLATLSEEDAEKLKSVRPDEQIPGWAFRFLQAIPEVTVILSGMSNEAQLKENIKTFETEKPLNNAETELLIGIADDMVKRTTVPCTGCSYCTSYCKKGLDIPYLLKLYNESRVSGSGIFISSMAVKALPEDKRPSACLECHSCEQVCPQGIKIPEFLKNFDKRKY